VGNVVAELRRLGLRADEEPDGLTVHPGPVRPTTVQTYDDHRMAMAFALAGLRVPGIQIADPGCVAKTFPDYWRMLDELRAPSAAGAIVRPA
jgi:3-phosphoshikimate 1-carboxyvinyltransferase